MEGETIFAIILITIGLILLFGLISYQLQSSQGSGCRGSVVDVFDIGYVQVVIEITFVVLFVVATIIIVSETNKSKKMSDLNMNYLGESDSTKIYDSGKNYVSEAATNVYNSGSQAAYNSAKNYASEAATNAYKSGSQAAYNSAKNYAANAYKSGSQAFTKLGVVAEEAEPLLLL